LLSKPVFEGCERADPIGELDPRSPTDRGNVYPGDATPARHDQPSQDDEQHEPEMQNNCGVGESAKAHDSTK
jgi:hypothetical protein